MQHALLFNRERQAIDLGDGALWYYPNWLPEPISQVYFHQLEKYCAWQQSAIRLAGREVRIPRLNAWYGEPGAHYRYSGKDFQPLAWTRALNALRLRLQRQLAREHLNATFNSALVNFYRDGNDSVAWHADNEPELGSTPTIASVSLGASRRFLLKRRDGRDKVTLELGNGSLLIMLPPLQSHWVHCLPKTKQFKQSRINVTYRQVMVR